MRKGTQEIVQIIRVRVVAGQTIGEPRLGVVGGDFYHYFLLDSDHLCFVIGDVSDKGIPAALFMAMTLTAFVVFAKDRGRTLPEGLRLLNQYLCENNQSQMFVTLYAGIVNLRTGILEYCDAGHEPPFLIRRDDVPRLTQK